MLRKLILTSAAAALSTAPVIAQAAPVRTAAPMTDQADSLAGGGIIIPLLVFAAVAALFVVLWDDGDNDALPTSP